MAQRMPQDRKSAVILIAEDDREMRSILCDELYDLGVSYEKRLWGRGSRSARYPSYDYSHGSTYAAVGLD